MRPARTPASARVARSWSATGGSARAPALGSAATKRTRPRSAPGGWSRFVARANEGIDRIGARLGLPVVDAAALKDTDQFVDVCHLNAKGNDVLARAIAGAIER